MGISSTSYTLCGVDPLPVWVLRTRELGSSAPIRVYQSLRNWLGPPPTFFFWCCPWIWGRPTGFCYVSERRSERSNERFRMLR